MTDNAWSHQPAGDNPALDAAWCSQCQRHRSEYAGGKCPMCNGHEAASTARQRKAREEGAETCSPSETPSDRLARFDTTSTDGNAASTGARSPVADSTTHMTALSIARRWMSLSARRGSDNA